VVNRFATILWSKRAVLGGLLVALAAVIACGSLATLKGFYDPITAELRAGNYEQAAVAIEKAKEKNKYGHKDRFVYYIDAGLAHHYARQYDTSNVRLTAAEDAAEDLFTKSITRAALSLMLNDNVLEYAGEDYEILYGNLFKALNYIAKNNVEDAFVEIRKANEKLNLLELKYRKASDELNKGTAEDTAAIKLHYEAEKVRFNNDAFARYLSMHLYASAGMWDDARIDFDWLQKAFLEQPHIYDFDTPDVRYTPEEKGMSILSIVGLAGLSPVKEALNLRIRTDKELDLIQVLYTDPERKDTEYGHIPWPVDDDYYFKLAIPQLVDRPGPIAEIQVYVDSMYLGNLQLIEDVSKVARETFNAKKSLIYLRSVARAVAKGLVTHKQKKKVDDDNKAAGWLAKLAIDAISDITENADLRCARLLPGKIFVGDFDVPPGNRDIEVVFLDENGRHLETQSFKQYKILRNGLNMVEAYLID